MIPVVESKPDYGIDRTRIESLNGITDDRTKNSDLGLPGNSLYGGSSGFGSSSKKWQSSSKNVSGDSIDETYDGIGGFLGGAGNGNSFKKNKGTNAGNGNNNEIEKECVLEFGSSNDKSKKSSNNRRSRAEPGYPKRPGLELDEQDLADIDDFIQEQELQGNLLGSKHRPYEQKQNSLDLGINNNRQLHNSHNNLMQEEENWSHNFHQDQSQNINNTKEDLEFSDEEAFVFRPKRKKNSDIFGDKSAKPSIKKIPGNLHIDQSPNLWPLNQTPVKNDEFLMSENVPPLILPPTSNKMSEEIFSPTTSPNSLQNHAHQTPIPKSDLTHQQTQMDN